jgi:hypothetical protein
MTAHHIYCIDSRAAGWKLEMDSRMVEEMDLELCLQIDSWAAEWEL